MNNTDKRIQYIIDDLSKYICKIELSKKVGWPLPTAFAFVYLRILCSNS